MKPMQLKVKSKRGGKGGLSAFAKARQERAEQAKAQNEAVAAAFSDYAQSLTGNSAAASPGAAGPAFVKPGEAAPPANVTKTASGMLLAKPARSQLQQLFQTGASGAGSGPGLPKKRAAPSELFAGLTPLDGKLGSKARTIADVSTSNNICIGKLPPSVTETDIRAVFQPYGDVATVKVMWPRSDEERARGYNVGFVCFYDREDAASAMAKLHDWRPEGRTVNLSWAKAMPVPPRPAQPGRPSSDGSPSAAPPAAQQAHVDQRGSGQEPAPARRPRAARPPMPEGAPHVPVAIPADAQLRRTIDRVAWYVAQHGAALERQLSAAARELDWDWMMDRSALGAYYRWRTWAFQAGDGRRCWDGRPFQMTRGGVWWCPPLPDAEEPPEDDRCSAASWSSCDSTGHSAERRRDRSTRRAGRSSQESAAAQAQRVLARWEQDVRAWPRSAADIAQCTLWAYDHAEHAESLVRVTVETAIAAGIPQAAVSALYILADWVANSTAPVPNSSTFKRAAQLHLPALIQHILQLQQVLLQQHGRMSAAPLAQRVQRTMQAWQAGGAFPQLYLWGLEAALAAPAHVADMAAAATKWRCTAPADQLPLYCAAAAVQHADQPSADTHARLAWVAEYAAAVSGQDVAAQLGLERVQEQAAGGSTAAATAAAGEQRKATTPVKKTSAWTSVQDTSPGPLETLDVAEPAVSEEDATGELLSYAEFQRLAQGVQASGLRLRVLSDDQWLALNEDAPAHCRAPAAAETVPEPAPARAVSATAPPSIPPPPPRPGYRSSSASVAHHSPPAREIGRVGPGTDEFGRQLRRS